MLGHLNVTLASVCAVSILNTSEVSIIHYKNIYEYYILQIIWLISKHTDEVKPPKAGI